MANYAIDEKYFCYRKLLAEYYDCIFPECNGEELDFWLDQIKHSEKPILEIGCGTGRVTIPLLTQGYNLTVIDTSPFMLDRFRTKCTNRNLQAIIFEQAAQNLNINERFGMIFIADCGLGLFTKDDEVRLVFARIMEHLKPGGLFVFEIETIYAARNIQERNGIWQGKWTFGKEGILFAKRQLTQYQPDTHIRESLLVLEKYRDGSLVETEANLGIMRFYSALEVIQLLESTDFINISVTKWLSNGPPSEDSEILSIRCNKPDA